MRLKFLLFNHAIFCAISGFAISPVYTESAYAVHISAKRPDSQADFSKQTFLAQGDASSPQITNIRVEPVDAELEIIFETLDNKTLLIDANQFRTKGDRLIADIPNAQLALDNGRVFRVNEPTADIANVEVRQLNNNSVRVTVQGQGALPTTNVVLKTDIFAYVLNPAEVAAEQELIVTGEQPEDTGLNTPSSTATGIEAPILETPFSIQIISDDILRDQQSTQLEDVLQNVSGVAIQGSVGGRNQNISLRGFPEAPVLRDGFRRYSAFQADPELANLEQVEVIKGAASILYGEIQPGGVINLVSKQPLAEPFHEAELQFGSRGLLRSRIDSSGPLTEQEDVLYRLNVLFSNQDSFKNYDTPYQRLLVAPTVAWQGDRTDLKISLEYLDDQNPTSFGLPVLGRSVVDIPRDRIVGEPGDKLEKEFFSFGYDFEHRFSDAWKIRNAFRYSSYDYAFNVLGAFPLFFDESTGILGRTIANQEGDNDNISLLTNILGEFATGDIKHTLLFGVDLNQSQERIVSFGEFFSVFPLDLFNPVYGQIPDVAVEDLPPFGGTDSTTDRLGIYVQDKISLWDDDLILLAGVRYDSVHQTTENLPGLFTEPGTDRLDVEAITPRLGALYQINDNLAVYGSYSKSFNPIAAYAADGQALEPERGAGFEVGIKTELFDSKLLATAAYFDITKQNVAVTNPNNPLFSIATGEQRSRGFEFDISGELAPGWNVIASYTHTDAEVTEDTDASLVGNRLFGVPYNSASLWTTYEFQQGDFQGLGFGLGFKYVGERSGDLANSFDLDSYFTTDAAVFYRRDDWRFALNLKNIGNVKYIESTNGSRTSGNHYGEPFSVIGSVTYQF